MDDHTEEEYQQVLKLVQSEDTISASLIQRRMSKSYQWTCSVLDRLEADGIVEPFHGNRNRKVLKK